MSKIPSYLENPFDVFFIYLSEKSSTFYRDLEFTPNNLTTLSFVTGIMSIILFYYERYKLSAIFYLISYYYDSVDGFYARKYNMVTRFGDLYDHVSDFAKNFIIIILIIYRLHKNTKIFMFFLSFLIIIALTVSVQTGCQQLYLKNDESVLNYFSSFCTDDPEKVMKYMRFFGSGTFYVVIAYIIYNFDSYS